MPGEVQSGEGAGSKLIDDASVDEIADGEAVDHGAGKKTCAVVDRYELDLFEMLYEGNV